MLPPADAVELEVFKHLLAAIAEEMGGRLMRSAFSPNIKERRDFSCALFDAGGSLLAQAAHIPVHLGAMPLSVQAVLAAFPAGLQAAGDMYVVNDPYAGGTHLPDITVVAPCRLPGENGPRFFVANRAHHADIGGISPGSMPLSRSIDEEGLRIAPRRLDAATIDWIAGASRTPDERRGDLRAQVAALELGRRRIEELCAKHGSELVECRGRELIAYTERLMRRVIDSIPDGAYVFADRLDGDGTGVEDIVIRCRLAISGDRAVVDFRDSADQVPGPVNAVRAITVSAVNYVFSCLGPAALPSNAGVMRPVEVLTRPGSVLEAQAPAAVAAGNVETSQRIVDVLLGALSQALPDVIPAASCGSMNNLAIGGFDPRHDTDFAYYETLAGGAGAGPHRDGLPAVHTHMTNTLNTPVEAVEHAYPLRLAEYRIRTGSGGAGQQRGGDGVVRSYVFDHVAELTLLTERRRHAPYGLAGGLAGEAGRNVLLSADGSRRELPGKCRIQVMPGDRLEIATPGGGGWGEPKR
ncbi:hydantoinase B/oxoprolinase family protein [bacterium]|nr:hydantoinase B/oxoprolinase family protein [bacterium]